MKLTYFSSQTLPKGVFGGKAKTPRISLGKNGLIAINGAGCHLLSIKEGDKVSIAQDQDEPANWYIFKDPDQGYELRLMYDKKSCGFNHNGFVTLFKDAMGITDPGSISYIVAGTPTTFTGSKVKYWGILIS